MQNSGLPVQAVTNIQQLTGIKTFLGHLMVSPRITLDKALVICHAKLVSRRGMAVCHYISIKNLK